MTDNLSYSKGVSWFNDCRIPFVDEKVPRLNIAYKHKTNNNFGGGNDGRYGTTTMSQQNNEGRFPANILVSDDVLNDGVITKQSNRYYEVGTGGQGFYGVKSNGITQAGDKGTNSRYYDLDKWFEKLITDVE